jgi:gamma-resorcylate decarboxylase
VDYEPASKMVVCDWSAHRVSTVLGEVMKGKIALEEHFAIEATLSDSKVFGTHVWDELGPRLIDFQEKRIQAMDASGVEIMILSLNAPAVQAIHDVKRAMAVAHEANDVLAAEIAKRPDRFRGFAALAMQDPEESARELTRCVNELGFVGALVNGFSQAGTANSALYYDLPQYRPFWRTVAELDVPFYLHPRNPLPNTIPSYEGHNWLLGPTWAFHAETAVHALRLMAQGCSTSTRAFRSSSVTSAKVSRHICGVSITAMNG